MSSVVTLTTFCAIFIVKRYCKITFRLTRPIDIRNNKVYNTGMRKAEFEQEIRQVRAESKAIRLLTEGARKFEAPEKSVRYDVYYPREIIPLDGDPNNKAFGNLAIVCPRCYAHILLSRFSRQDIWLLKARGLSYAEIGRLLNLSRQRVRQLCQQYETAQKGKREAELNVLLVKKAERIENYLIASGKLKRRIDRRTKKKRIIAELNKLREKEAQNERKRKTKKQK